MNHREGAPGPDGPGVAASWRVGLQLPGWSALWGVVVVCVVGLLASRLVGPSDLYDQHQPRTIAYTADMLLHGRWVLPRDDEGIPATKPPLYNWLSAPLVWMFGYREWMLKAPSVLAGVAGIGVVGGFGWMLVRPRRSGLTERCVDRRVAFAWVAALVFWVNPAIFKLMYLARPDMVLVACLTGAWVCGTLVLSERSSRPIGWQVGFWLCTAASALTKGPIALLPLGYVVLAARLVHGRWSRVHRTGWVWGLPLMLVLVAAWAVPAWRADPEYFRQKLMGGEVSNHVVYHDPVQFLKKFWKAGFYFFTRFLPWSVFVPAALIWIGPRRWLRHRCAPAILWFLLTLVVFSCMPMRSDRVAPMYPAAAVLAAYWLVWRGHRVGLTVGRIAALALALALVMAGYQWTGSPAARTGYGDHVAAFAQTVRPIIGDEPVVLIGVGKTPLATLLGRHQPGEPTGAEIEAASWIIRPYVAEDSPAAVSQPIAEVQGHKFGRVALYDRRR